MDRLVPWCSFMGLPNSNTNEDDLEMENSLSFFQLEEFHSQCTDATALLSRSTSLDMTVVNETSHSLATQFERTPSPPPVQSRWKGIRQASFTARQRPASSIPSLPKQTSLRRLFAVGEGEANQRKKVFPGKPSRFAGFPSMGRTIKAKTTALVERIRGERQRKSAWYSDELNHDSDEYLVRTFRTNDTEIRTSESASSLGCESMDFGMDDKVDTIPKLSQETDAPENNLVASISDEPHPSEVVDPEPDPEQVKPNGRFLFKPPMSEVSRRKLDVSGDFSDVSSDVSSDLSTSSPYRPLEFSLLSGFGSKASFLLPVSNKIVQSMERQKSRFSAPSKCLILVLDPERKIFEIVTIRNVDATTTLGDLISRLPGSTSDRRLSKLKFSGLCSNGTFLDSPEATIEIMDATRATKTPLIGVPEGSKPKTIMALANSLLNTPQVAKLLKDGLNEVEQ